MRPLKEVFADVTRMKCRKDIQKAYDAIRDRYQAFEKKSGEIIKETQMRMMFQGMTTLVQQGKMMCMLSREEVGVESRKRIDQECVEELAAIKEANTEFVKEMGRLMAEYPEELLLFFDLLLSVGDELDNSNVLVRNGERMWKSPDEK